MVQDYNERSHVATPVKLSIQRLSAFKFMCKPINQ